MLYVPDHFEVNICLRDSNTVLHMCLQDFAAYKYIKMHAILYIIFILTVLVNNKLLKLMLIERHNLDSVIFSDPFTSLTRALCTSYCFSGH